MDCSEVLLAVLRNRCGAPFAAGKADLLLQNEKARFVNRSEDGGGLLMCKKTSTEIFCVNIRNKQVEPDKSMPAFSYFSF